MARVLFVLARRKIRKIRRPLSLLKAQASICNHGRRARRKAQDRPEPSMTTYSRRNKLRETRKAWKSNAKKQMALSKSKTSRILFVALYDEKITGIIPSKGMHLSNISSHNVRNAFLVLGAITNFWDCCDMRRPLWIVRRIGGGTIRPARRQHQRNDLRASDCPYAQRKDFGRWILTTGDKLEINRILYVNIRAKLRAAIPGAKISQLFGENPVVPARVDFGLALTRWLSCPASSPRFFFAAVFFAGSAFSFAAGSP